ncbi:DUF3885 domain-containing protein [Actinoplanes awajinensis]
MRSRQHPVDVARVGRAWDTSWPGCPPVARVLRRGFSGQSVRFYTLPGGKRYATSDSEHAEILRRHHVLLTAIFRGLGSGDGLLTAVTCSWSAASQPPPRDSAVASTTPDAVHWRSDDLSTGPRFPSWQHHYVSQLDQRDPALDQLLLCVADDMTDDVMLFGDTGTWAYHPYDGGAEVFAPDAGARDQLAAAHADWAVPTSPAT